MVRENTEFRDNSKKIITGGIFIVMCIALCCAGIWGCANAVRGGHGQADAAYADAEAEETGQTGAAHSGTETQPERLTPDSVERIIEGILKWQCAQYHVSDVQELLDTGYAECAASGIVQTYVLGLYDYMPSYNYGCYLWNVRNTVLEKEVQGLSLQKAVVTLSQLQEADIPVTVAALEEVIGQQGFMSYLYGLLVMDGASYEGGVWAREALIEEILQRQLQDGGFAVIGTDGDVDVTAMTLQTLAPYYRIAQGQETGSQKENQSLSPEQTDRLISAVERALSFLSERQLATGDYENRGTPNAESTAQVIMALCALGKDVWSDEQFRKDGATLADGLSRYRNAEGAFSHTKGAPSNDMATSQAFAALAALYRMDKEACFLSDRTCEGKADDTDGQNETEQEDAGGNGIAQNAQEQKGGAARGMAAMELRTALLLLLFAADSGYLAYLCLERKLSRKRIGGVVLVTAFLAAAVWLVRIQTREEYLRQEHEYDGDRSITVTMEIRCDTVAGREDYLPADGVIMVKTQMSVSEGASAFAVLKEAARALDIPIEYEGTVAGDEFAYIEGIAYLYEYDFGELSGWVFLVNGDSPDTGCGSYLVEDGDEIVWYYTTELGRDVKQDG